MNNNNSSNNNKHKVLSLRNAGVVDLLRANNATLCESVKITNKTATSVTLNLPGLHYNDFNRLSKPSLWSMVRYMEHDRPVSMMPSSRNTIFSLGSTLSKTPVVSHQLLKFTRGLHNHIKLGQPLTLTSALGFMSKKSYSYHEVLRDEETADILVENHRLLMLLDRETGQPCRLPDDIKAKFSPHMTTERITVTTPPPLHPYQHTYTWYTHAVHSDTDMVYHINQAVYSRYCVDCATDATSSGFYTQLQGDFLMYDVASMHCSYVREVFPGDNVAVITWQDRQDWKTLYFVVENVNNKQPVFKCVMTLFQTSHQMSKL